MSVAVQSTAEGAARFKVGDELPPLSLPPLSRTTCALFAGASGDHNPIHIDIAAARAAGLPDVISHGMLSMALLGRLVTRWAPQSSLRQLSVKFENVTHIGDAITCTGRVVERTLEKDAVWLRIEIRAADQSGQTKTTGEALIVLS